MAFVKGQSGNPGGRPKAVIGGKTLTEIAREHTPEAIQALADALADESVTARISAATALLDRGWGRPAQSVTVSGDAENPLALSVDVEKLNPEQLRALASIPLTGE
jgi:hypothetical protein